MRKVIPLYIIILLCPLFAGTVMAQATLSAELSKTRIGEQEYLQVRYVIENATELNSFKEPSFNGFKIVGLQKPFGQVINSNGGMSRYYAFIYTLEPVKTGNYTFDPATAKADNKLLGSKAMKVQVVNGPSPDRPSGNVMIVSLKSAVRSPAVFLNDFVLQEKENADNKIRQQIFVKVETNKKEVFEGEPILTTYKLYTRLRNEARITKRPPFNGFSVYEMPDNGWNAPQVESVNGKRYEVYVIRRAQLFPLQSGPAQLESVEVECKTKLVKGQALKNADISAEQLAQDYYYNALSDELMEVYTTTINTEPIAITVKELPAGGKPEKFSGAVGEFSIDAMLNKEVFETGEAVSLAIKIKGNGNLPVISAPLVDWPKNVESFEPKVTERYDAMSVPLTGEKIFEYSFVPTQEGAVIIPAVEFNYFDPATQQYRSVTTRSFTLDVKKGNNKYVAKASEDDVDKRSNKRKFYEFIGGRSLLVLLGLIVTVFFLVKWNRKQKVKEESNTKNQWQELLKETSIEPIAITEEPGTDFLRRARLLLEEPGKYFYNSLQNDIWDFLQKKTGLLTNDRSKSALRNHLLKNNIPAETINKLVSILTLCETALYSPVDPEEDHLKILHESEEIIKQLP